MNLNRNATLKQRLWRLVKEIPITIWAVVVQFGSIPVIAMLTMLLMKLHLDSSEQFWTKIVFAELWVLMLIGHHSWLTKWADDYLVAHIFASTKVSKVLSVVAILLVNLGAYLYFLTPANCKNKSATVSG